MPALEGERVIFETRVSKPLKTFQQDDLSPTTVSGEFTVLRTSPELVIGFVTARERIIELEAEGETVRIQRVLEKKAPFRKSRVGQILTRTKA